MHADRVDVFHIADDDAVVGAVAQHFVLDLFPAQQRGFEESLADQTRGQSDFERFEQLFLVVDDSAAGSTQRVGGAHDQRIPRAARERGGLVEVRHDRALGDRLADLDHLLLEQIAVFGQFNGFDRRSEQRDAVALQDSGFVQFDCQIEPGLAAERGQERIGALPCDDLLNRGNRERLEIDRVGNLRIGHDRGRIRVD